MKQFTKYVFILALMVMIFQTKAQDNKISFSLQESIDYSLKHSPSYLNAELDYQSADYRRKEIRGIGLPQVNGSIDVKDYINIPTSLLPAQIFGGPEGTFIPVKFGTKYNATAGVSASQIIFNSDYIFALKASKEFMDLSKVSVTRSKADLVSQVSRAYYLVLVNRETIKLLDANIERLKKAYDDTKAYNQQGFAELIDVERLEVQYNNLVVEKDKVIKLIGVSEIMLKFQMGYNTTDPISLTDSLNVSDFQDLSATRIDVTQRPDYQLLQKNQSLLDIDVKRLKWGYLPTLAAYGSYQYNAQRNDFNLLSFDKNDPTKQWFKVALVGVTLNLNIFDGLQRNYKIQQAKITSVKNQNTMRTLQLGAELEANSASVAYSNAYMSVNAQKRNMELAQHVYDVAQKKYQGGVGGNIEVVTAQTALREAQTNYVNAVYNMVVAKIDYQKATGTLVK